MTPDMALCSNASVPSINFFRALTLCQVRGDISDSDGYRPCPGGGCSQVGQADENTGILSTKCPEAQGLLKPSGGT